MILTCLSAFGRQSVDLLDTPINLQSQKVRLDTLLQTITRKTGLRFSYNSKRLNTAYTLALPSKKVTAREILDQLRTKTNVLYSRVENHVILNIEKSTIQQNPSAKPTTPARIQPTSLKPAPPEQTKPVEPQVDQQKEVAISVDTLSVAAPVVPLPDTATALKSIVATQTNNAVLPMQDSSSVQPATVALPAQRDTPKPRPAPVVNTKRNQKKPGYFIDLGISTGETLFIGATLRTGTNSFFGTLSIRSNGSSAILLYGLSGSLRAGGRSKIVLNTYLGTYSKSFRATRSADSVVTNHTISVSGLWAGINGGVEWKLNTSGSWKLFVGLSFNALESRYRVDGKNQGLTGMPGSNPERKYAAFYPFYTLSNTYDDTSFESLKTWLGLHVGLYRTIFSR